MFEREMNFSYPPPQSPSKGGSWSCPQLDGAIVFQARALYESLNGNNFIIEGDCLGGDREPHPRFSQQGGAVISTESSKQTQDFITDLLVYPNPTKDKFFITANNIKNASISIFDQQGRQIEIHSTLIHEHLIEFSNNLSSGLYVICIMDGSEKILKKITVE